MRWLTNSLVVLLSLAGWLMTSPQYAHGQILAVWGWRNLVAPELGGPWIAPDIRFRPLGLLDNDPIWNPGVTNGQAVVIVNLPDPNARVWIDGHLTRESGTQRVFVTPPLAVGFDYSYAIRARWGEGENSVEQTRTVPIRAGQRRVVDFARPAVHMPLAER